MLLSTRIKMVLTVWAVGESVLFFVVVGLIGFPGACLVTLLTTLFGWSLLKRAGASALMKMRASFDGRLAGANAPRFVDETLATFGALMLLMPGFLSDIVGVILAVPAARRRLSRWMGGRPIARRPSGRANGGDPSTIDLDPADWERTDARQPVQKV